MTRNVFIDKTPIIPEITTQEHWMSFDLRTIQTFHVVLKKLDEPYLFCRVWCDICDSYNTNIRRGKLDWPWCKDGVYEDHTGRWRNSSGLIKTLHNGREKAYCKKCWKREFGYNKFINRQEYLMRENKRLISKIKKEITNERRIKNDRPTQNLSC